MSKGELKGLDSIVHYAALARGVAGMTAWGRPGGHPPLTSLRSFAPPSFHERGGLPLPSGFPPRIAARGRERGKGRFAKGRAVSLRPNRGRNLRLEVQLLNRGVHLWLYPIDIPLIWRRIGFHDHIRCQTHTLDHIALRRVPASDRDV